MNIVIVDQSASDEFGHWDIDSGLSFVTVINEGGMGEIKYVVPALHNRNNRLQMTLKYVEALLTKSGMPKQEQVFRFLFQCEDCPQDISSVSWETKEQWTNIHLVPDLYYFNSGGYFGFLQQESEIPVWEDRTATVFWRGQTTGIVNLTPDKLKALPRYNLCRIASQFGDKADVGLTGVVQATPNDSTVIETILLSEGLKKSFMPMKEFAAYRFLIDIDGNSNAWNLLQKMRLGCCMLRVISPWRQWIEHRLVAWEHYIPIKQDLSDFEEQVDWCLSNDKKTQDIAKNARKFALAVEFDSELDEAANQLILASKII